MPRLPTTLQQLLTVEDRLKVQDARLKNQRDAVAKQRRKLEHQARQARWLAVGQLAEQCGLPMEDMASLALLFTTLAQEKIHVPR